MGTDDVMHVTPGGPARRVDAGGITLLKVSVSDMDNNCYVLTAHDGAQLLVDAADDAPRLLALLDEARAERGGAGSEVAGRDGAGSDGVASGSGGGRSEHVPRPGRRLDVVTTHRHQDHWRALDDVVRATGARVLAGDEDADALPVPVDVRLRHGDRVRLGPHQLEVIALRGHTPGSVALAWTEVTGPRAGRVHLFSGDSLFPGGPGRTTSPAAFSSLLDDLVERVFARFADDTVVHPGHGDATTLGTERPDLEEWRERGW